VNGIHNSQLYYLFYDTTSLGVVTMFLSSGFLSSSAFFVLCHFVYSCLPLFVVFSWFCCQVMGEIEMLSKLVRSLSMCCGVVKWLAIRSIKAVGNKKKAETFRDGELALQASLGAYEDVFSKKLYFGFSYRASCKRFVDFVC
jgi:hypothetical protein